VKVANKIEIENTTNRPSIERDSAKKNDAKN
jgi:hypothetical protein